MKTNFGPRAVGFFGAFPNSSRRLPRLIGLGAALLLLAAAAGPAPGATLQELIDATPPGGTLNLPAGVFYGPATASNITIVGSSGTFIESVTPPLESAISTAGESKLISLTFRDNYRALTSTGELTVSNCVFIGNGRFDNGGAILNGGNLLLCYSLIRSNMALDGGGIYNGGTATLQHVTMEFNNVVYTAGAIRSFASGMLTLEDCVIRENHADHPWDGYGGGIVGNFSARNTIICGNTSPRYADYRGEYTDLGGNFIGDCAAGVSIRFVDGLARINVSGAKTYALQAATSANGPWETVKEETAPFTFTESEKAGAKFYRIVQRAD